MWGGKGLSGTERHKAPDKDNVGLSTGERESERFTKSTVKKDQGERKLYIQILPRNRDEGTEWIPHQGVVKGSYGEMSQQTITA